MTNKLKKGACRKTPQNQMAQECLDVILERVNNIIKLQEDNHKENKEEHASIIARQDHTNGSVKKHEKFIYMLMGGWGITTLIVFPLLSFIMYYIITDLKEEIDRQKSYTAEQIISFDKRIQTAIDINNQKQFEEYNK